MKHVTLGLDTLHPDTWTRHEVTDVCAFLKEQFGAQFPDTARIYHLAVALQNDVTPGSKADIDRLQEMPGPFYVMVYPGWVALPYIFAVVLAIASYVLAPSPSAAPVVAQRNTTSASPNNDLSDRSNKARPNARIPDIFGTVRSTPDLIAAPYKIFENNKEVEYAYMCVGRGAHEITELSSGEFDIRDGETLCSRINGCSVAIYAPDTSPNSGDSPQLQIGSAIEQTVLNTKRSNSVNGQVLRPPNSSTLAWQFRFKHPNIVQANPAGPQLGGYFVDGEEVTITGATLSAADPTLVTMDVTISSTDLPLYGFFAGGFVVGSTLPELATGQSIEITDISATIDGAGYDQTLDLSGTYVIDSVTDNYGDTGFGGSFYINTTVKLIDPQTINADWDDVDTAAAGNVTISKRFTIESVNGSLSFDLDGTYLVTSVDAYTLTLNNPSSVSADWANLSTVPYSPYIPVTIQTATAIKRYGPYILDVADMNRIFANFVAQNGLYKDNGTTQTAISVTVQLEVTPVSSSFVATGDPQTFLLTLDGSDSLKETVAKTLIANLTFTGRCSVYASRITESDTAFAGTVIDEVRWRDLYSVAPVEDSDFGNLTTVHSKTFATASALAVKERRLNMEVTRKIPVRDGITSNFTTALFASNNAAEIFCAVCLDPYIGRRRNAELDVDGIYDELQDVYDYFGTTAATEFNYTFDNDNMSFEETATAIAEAVFCVAYRRGNVLKWNFDKAASASTLLFNHRNKLPGSEKRTVTFGFNNDNDGLEYTYVDPDDDAVMTLYLPENYSARNPKKVESIGVRNDLQAYFHAWRIWNRMRYQHTAIEFDATQEADLLVRNDRILVTDGTRPYTQDGEVTAVDGLELTLSQNYWETYDLLTEDGEELTDESGDTLTTEGGTHVIWLQHTDGIAESIEISAGSAANKVVLATAPRLPLVTDPQMYARTAYIIIGTEDTQETAFLVTEKSAAENMTSTVKAVNYDARYYERDSDFINDLIGEGGYGPRGGHVSTPGGLGGDIT